MYWFNNVDDIKITNVQETNFIDILLLRQLPGNQK